MKIDAVKAIKLLREVVAGREDFVYKSPDGHGIDNPDYHCEYAHGDKPGCLIGVVLHQAGVTVDQLAELPANYVNNTEVLLQLREFGFTLTAGAEQVLRRAQAEQDNGNTWGKALEVAEQEYQRITEGQFE